MKSKRKSQADDSYVMFDVVYEDGTRSSHRRVPVSDLSRAEMDAHAKTVIMTQDRKIAEVSGRDRGAIRTIMRSSVKSAT